MKNWFSQLIELFEGPKQLKRPDFSRDVDEFIRLYPEATLVQWRELVVRSAESAYDAGYIAAELALVQREAGPTPEEIADIETPGWRDSPAIDPRGDQLAPFVVDAMIIGDAREK